MSIHVGVGGWTFEPWRGTFYPPKHPQKRELGSGPINSPFEV